MTARNSASQARPTRLPNQHGACKGHSKTQPQDRIRVLPDAAAPQPLPNQVRTVAFFRLVVSLPQCGPQLVRRHACVRPLARCAPAPPRVTWQLCLRSSKGSPPSACRPPLAGPMLACLPPSRHQGTSLEHAAIALIPRDPPPRLESLRAARCKWNRHAASPNFTSISGLVVEYIVAIDVTRVRFPADALIALSFRRASPPRALCMPRLFRLAGFLASSQIPTYANHPGKSGGSE